MSAPDVRSFEKGLLGYNGACGISKVLTVIPLLPRLSALTGGRPEAWLVGTAQHAFSRIVGMQMDRLGENNFYSYSSIFLPAWDVIGAGIVATALLLI